MLLAFPFSNIKTKLNSKFTFFLWPSAEILPRKEANFLELFIICILVSIHSIFYAFRHLSSVDPVVDWSTILPNLRRASENATTDGLLVFHSCRRSAEYAVVFCSVSPVGSRSILARRVACGSEEIRLHSEFNQGLPRLPTLSLSSFHLPGFCH